MAESPNTLDRALREQGARYVVDAQGQPVAVLLTVEEYDHYLDLLDDEADSQDKELALRLVRAATQENSDERQTFHDYLRERESSDGPIQS